MSTGYEVGPTETDIAFATMYATDVMNKEQCLAHPDKYTWVPTPTTRYPCPAGLACESGVCQFNQTGCEATSEQSFYDCKRVAVPCNTHSSGQCHVCDYEITGGHNIGGLQLAESEDTTHTGCYPGDYKYAPDTVYPSPLYDDNGDAITCTTGNDCVDIDGAVCGDNVDDPILYRRCYVPAEQPPQLPRMCPPLYVDPTPYTVKMYDPACPAECADGQTHDCGEHCPVVDQTVSCETDADCARYPYPGGACGREPGTQAYGKCYDNNAQPRPYLKWYDEIDVWNGLPPQRNVCMEESDYNKRWCEMPWTRASAAPENLAVPIEQRVKGSWKTRARPPFWYDDATGRCHVTKSYCTNKLSNGGFSAGYGNNVDYFLLSDCSHPQGQGNEVTDGYDCCTQLEDSIMEFLWGGRTISTNLREAILEGDAHGFRSQWNSYLRRIQGGLTDDATSVGEDDEDVAEDVTEDETPVDNPQQRLREVDPSLASTLDFVCDARLKSGLQRIVPHMLPGGIHGYRWTWNQTAQRLWGLSGPAQGLVTSELKRLVPDNIVTDRHGVEHYRPPQHVDSANALVMAALMTLDARPISIGPHVA